MKSKKGLHTRLLLWSLVLLLAALPGKIMAQSTDSGGEMIFSQEELDQMLAPIALYPDELLAQVLIAATYPLEVVRASRWVQANPNLKGDQLAAVLEQQDWDPSVKSLVNFPSVLQMMNDRLEWTQRLGDAFLAQEDEVMDTVQELRRRAQAEGSLRTTNEQTVIEDAENRSIFIEPAAPEVIYVPVYDPRVVYGPWWWPAYPPYYWHPRGSFVGIGFGVRVGVAWGYAWCGFNWHQRDVVINVTRNVYVNNRIDRNRYLGHVAGGSGGQAIWRHDPVHRGGVAYRSPAVAQRYGRGPLPGAEARRDLRGFDTRGTEKVIARQPGRPSGPQLRDTAGMGATKAEPPRPASAPVQQPRVPPSPGVTKIEPPGQATAPTQQPRATARPAVVRTEPSRQVPAPVQPPRVPIPPSVTKTEPPKQAAVPAHQPQTTPGPGVTRIEPPKQTAIPTPEPRVTTTPSVTKVEPGRPTPAPNQQPRVPASPSISKGEPPRQPAAPTPQARVPTRSAVTKAESPRQPVAPIQQPRVTTSPGGQQGVQGQKNPTAFSGFGSGSQARQSSNRGNESLSGVRTGGPAPSVRQPAPTTGGSRGGTLRDTVKR